MSRYRCQDTEVRKNREGGTIMFCQFVAADTANKIGCFGNLLDGFGIVIPKQL